MNLYNNSLAENKRLEQPEAFCNPIYLTVCLRPRNLPMKAASCSPYRAARNTSLLHHSTLTTHYHTASWHAYCYSFPHVLWCRLVCSAEIRWR